MEVTDGLTLTLGGTTLALVAKEIFAWLRSRNQKTEISPQPLGVEGEIGKKPKYVTVQEFNRHVEDNARDHENLFGRMNRNDRETSEIKGILTGMRDDLSAIKQKLFRTK